MSWDVLPAEVCAEMARVGDTRGTECWGRATASQAFEHPGDGVDKQRRENHLDRWLGHDCEHSTPTETHSSTASQQPKMVRRL